MILFSPLRRRQGLGRFLHSGTASHPHVLAAGQDGPRRPGEVLGGLFYGHEQPDVFAQDSVLFLSSATAGPLINLA